MVAHSVADAQNGMIKDHERAAAGLIQGSDRAETHKKE